MLLRLTKEILENVPGYFPEPDVLPILLDFLDDLDEAWLVVLRGKIWQPRESDSDDEKKGEEDLAETRTTTLLSQTEQTRLRSLLRWASGRFEDWLIENDPSAQGQLDSVALHPGFGRLFMRSLEELDGLEDGMDVD